MKFHLAVSLCAVCLYSSSALPQDVLSVPITDKSGAGAPCEVSGTATLRESSRASMLEWSWGEKVALKNVSDKPILLFVATLTEVGRHSAPTARHAALGDGPTYQLEDDRFFSEELIQPGARIVLRDTSPGDPDVACCINPLEDTHAPSAEYRLEFAQFADGSVFGDPAKAQRSLAIRGTILRGLHQLLESYERGGEVGFLRALGILHSYAIGSAPPPNEKEQPPFFTTAICRQILASYDSDGARAALDKTRNFLKIAETHDATLVKVPE